MALPRTAPSSWMESLDFSSRLFESGSTDYELYEEDDKFCSASSCRYATLNCPRRSVSNRR